MEKAQCQDKKSVLYHPEKWGFSAGLFPEHLLSLVNNFEADLGIQSSFEELEGGCDNE